MNPFLIMYISAVSSFVSTDSIIQSGNLPEVIVIEQSNSKLNTPQLGVEHFSQKDVLNVPAIMGEPDVIKAIQLQPGVSAGTEGFAGMYVRGGNNDENLFVLDGVPVYNINHLGGLFSAFNVNAIKDINFYKSSFPARYGGRLSSIVDITSQEGSTSEYAGSISIGLLSGNFNIQGPIIKGKTSFNLSIRRSWLDLVSIPALAIINSAKSEEKTIAGYSFSDLNINVSHWFNADNKLCLNMYYGFDHLKIGEEQYSNISNKQLLAKDINNFNWGSFIMSVKWKKRINSRVNFDFNIYYNRYFAKLHQNIEEFSIPDESDNTVNSYINKCSDNNITDFGISLNFKYSPEAFHLLRFGTGYIRHRFIPERYQIRYSAEPKEVSVSIADKLYTNEFFLYAEDEFSISDRFVFNAGLRFSLFHAGSQIHTSLEPRLSANFKISPTVSLKADYSKMSQYIQQISNNFISLPTDALIPVTEHFKPLNSDQVSVGTYYNFKNNYTLSIEGYYKWLNNLLEYKDEYYLLPKSANWEDKLTTGNGSASGIDFSIIKNNGKLTGFIGYSLLWTNRNFKEINNGIDFPAKYDNRHKLNIFMNYQLNDKIDINACWIFMTGNLITLSLENYQTIDDSGFGSTIVPDNPYADEWGIPYYFSKNNFRLPAYHRLDIGLNIKTSSRGTLNINIYNAYCHMNAIAIERNNQLQTSSGEKLYPRFRLLSLFPIIPSISYTYKF